MEYGITDLGEFDAESFSLPGTLGASGSSANDVNNRGEVVGSSDSARGNIRAFLWNDILMAFRSDVELGSANAINDFGVVVGSANTPTGEIRPFLWDSLSGIRFLGTLGGLKSFGIDINNQNRVVGYSNTANDGPDSGADRAFLWDEVNGMQDLGVLPGGTTSQACAINNSDGAPGINVVGTSDTFITKAGAHIGALRAFWWNSLTGMLDLGTLGGINSYAFGIKDGPIVLVVGAAETTDGEIHAFLWSEQDMMQDLGTLLGGDYSQANGINRRGDIVGYSRSSGDPPCYGVGHAFVWGPTGMQDLNDLIPAGSGWLLTEASAINDLGQIVGLGIINYRTHGFLLTPSGT